MARRSIPMIEFDEVFYRFQQGRNLTRIARSVGRCRDTVRKYLRLALEAGLRVGGDEAERIRAAAAVRARLAPDSTPEPGLAQQRLAPHTEQIIPNPKCAWGPFK